MLAITILDTTTGSIDMPTYYICALIKKGRKRDVLKILGRVTRLDYRVIERELQKGRDDWTVLQRLRQLAPPVLVSHARPQRRSDLLLRLLSGVTRYESYLDVGCGDMTLTTTVKRDFVVPRGVVGATDVEVPVKISRGITFHRSDGHRIPFPDRSFELVTMFHAMHHFEHLEDMLGELNRVVTPNATLVIREHDCAPNNPCYDIISLVHVAYDAVHRNVPPHDPVHMSRTSGEWESILARYGWLAGMLDMTSSIDRIYTQVFYRNVPKK